MADELEAIAETEQAQPAIGEGEKGNVLEQADTDGTQEQEVEQPEGEEGAEGEEQPVDDGLTDLDFAFGKWRVDPKLAEAVTGLQKTFTEKTQTYNSELRELKAKAEARAEANEAELTARAQLTHVNQEMKRFEAYDWQAYLLHKQDDPYAAQEAWDYKQHLSQQKTHLEGEIQNQQTIRSQETQQEFAKRVEETRQFAMKEIEGWTPEMDQKLLEFAQSMEIPEDSIRSNLNPVFYKLLHRAWIGEQTLSRKPAAAKQPQQQAKPTSKIAPRSNPGAQKSLSEMNMDEYVAARRKQGL
jgi:hypothetical protein